MKKRCFSIYFDGMEIILPKSSVSFKYGYGIVKALVPGLMNGEPISLQVSGIVDENYNLCQELLPSFIIPKIEIYPDGKFVALYSESNDLTLNDYSVYVSILTENGLTGLYDLQAKDFDVIDDERILIKSMIDNNCSIMTIYNVVSGEILSPYYNYISKFEYKEEYNAVVANAVISVYNEILKKEMYIGCYIDKDGKVVSPYSLNGVFYDSDLEIEEVIELVRNKR